MRPVRPEACEHRLDRLYGRLSRLRVLLAVIVGLVLGLGAWSVNQSRELNRTRLRSVELRARLDSMRAVQHATQARIADDARRLTALEDRLGRLGRGVRHSELMSVRAWNRRLESRIDGNERQLATLEHRLSQGAHDLDQRGR